MSWLAINKEAAAWALSSGLRVQVTEVPDSPDDITCAVLDDEVDIHLVCPYFTSPAWTALSALTHLKADGYVWMCGLCNHDLSEERSIVCDACFVRLSRRQSLSRHRRVKHMSALVSAVSTQAAAMSARSAQTSNEESAGQMDHHPSLRAGKEEKGRSDAAPVRHHIHQGHDEMWGTWPAASDGPRRQQRVRRSLPTHCTQCLNHLCLTLNRQRRVRNLRLDGVSHTISSIRSSSWWPNH